jgi:hypothetical protein
VKTLILSRYSLSVCVAIILFAGCGRSLDAPGAVNTVIPGAVRMPPANGRMFQAGYSGTYSSVRRGKDGSITVDGNGTASFLGASRESGTLKWRCGAIGGCYFDGTLVLRSSKHPKVAIFMQVKWFNGLWCPAYAVHYTVSRGKRRFQGATGSGTVAFSCSGSSAYSDQWLGALSF